MKECKNCNGVDINCVQAGMTVYKGQEAYKEELICNDCGAEGEIIEYTSVDKIIYIGKIEDV